jgi:hypothetical protein
MAMDADGWLLDVDGHNHCFGITLDSNESTGIF